MEPQSPEGGGARRSGAPIIVILFAVLGLCTAALIIVWWLGAVAAEEGVEDVSRSLRRALVADIERQVYAFLELPFLGVDQLLSGHRAGAWSLMRADAFGQSPEAPMGAGRGLNANFSFSIAPPADQIRRGVPTWTIPCRYRSDCADLYASRPDYQQYCEDATDPWAGLGECVARQKGCRPYWAAGKGSGSRECPTEPNPKEPPYQCYEDLQPPHATWAHAVYPRGRKPTICRPNAMTVHERCDVFCPEFNRSYYKSNERIEFFQYTKTRSDYDPRSRSWYRWSARQVGRAYTNTYICSTTKMPCSSAVVPIHVTVPDVGATVVLRQRKVVVTGHTQTTESMYALRIRHAGGAEEVVGAEAVRLPCLSVADCAANSSTPGACEAACAVDSALPGPSPVAAKQTVKRKLVGIIGGDYESWSLIAAIDSIEVAKTGGLFIIERNAEANLVAVSSSLPCEATRNSPPDVDPPPNCFSKQPVGVGGFVDVNADPERVSAFDPYGGPVVSGVMRALFQNGSHTAVSGRRSVVVKIDDEQYWVEIVPIDPMAGPADRPLGIGNVDWILFLVVPQRDYLRDVIRDRERTLYISIGIACLVAIIFAIIALWMVDAPIRTLLARMDLACDMRIDEALAKPPRWEPVREICKLQTGFVTLCFRLREYRSFLPQSVLESQAEDEVDNAPKVPPPSDTVALCFTDIIGSTALWEASPEGMEEALTVHNTVVRKAIAQHGGYEVKTIGDAFMVAFQDAVACINFAVQVQEDLLGAQWPDDAQLAVASDYWAARKGPSGGHLWRGLALRIGVAYGPVRQEVNPVTDRVDYRGPTVNLAARCESVAPHGMVCINGSAHAHIGDPKLQGVKVVKNLTTSLKGIGEVEVYIISSERLCARLGGVTRVNVLSPGARLRASSSASEANSHRLSMHTDSQSDSRDASPVSSHPGHGQGLKLALAHTTGTVAVVAPLDSGITCLPRAHQSGSSLQTSQIISTTLQHCSVSAARTQGKVIAVIGVWAYVHWTVANRCPAHQNQAALFATYLTTAAPHVRIGLGSGDLYVGNVGTARQRFSTHAGLPVHIAVALCREAADFGARCLFASFPDAAEPEGAMGGRGLRPVDVWRLVAPRSSGESFITVREVNLSNADDNLPLTDMDASQDAEYDARFWAALRQGSEEQAAALLEAATSAGDTVGIRVGNRLVKHVRNNPEGAVCTRDAPFQTA
eukprot:TRINITY_DN11480_c0_g1_i1.p1 TRINITY_DN11480_c0_g1~~TRINITY_DN11480_c0_g1_i1.p1  ORF type:complete len:1208 (+),score=117.27 TRINITY_DN11480_c0_g1_i1:110-3733(+)